MKNKDGLYCDLCNRQIAVGVQILLPKNSAQKRRHKGLVCNKCLSKEVK